MDDKCRCEEEVRREDPLITLKADKHGACLRMDVKGKEYGAQLSIEERLSEDHSVLENMLHSLITSAFRTIRKSDTP